MAHRSPNFFCRHCLPMTFTMDDNEWVHNEKAACSASFSYWAVTGRSTGWNWPPGWTRSQEAKRHLKTSFSGLFYPILKKILKSGSVILRGVPRSQSVRHTSRLLKNRYIDICLRMVGISVFLDPWHSDTFVANNWHKNFQNCRESPVKWSLC